MVKALTLPDPNTDRYDAPHLANLSTNVRGVPGHQHCTHTNGGPHEGLFSFPDLDQTHMKTVSLPLPAVIIDGAPWFHLRDILKATEHRPYFIRRSMMPLAGVRKFLQDSDKPLARGLLSRIEAQYLQ